MSSNGASRAGPISTSTTCISAGLSSGQTTGTAWLFSSASWPAISTPVAPPPTTTMVNPPVCSSDMPAMVSMPPKIMSRTRSASARVYIETLYSAAPGMPKWLVVMPLATIR